MFRLQNIIVVLTLAFWWFSCGSDKNLATCSEEKADIQEISTKEQLEKTENTKGKNGCEFLKYEDDARLALDKEDYETAKKTLGKLISFYPDNYNYYGQLAASCAGIAGIDATTFIMKMTGEDNFFETGKEDLPSEGAAWQKARENIADAILWLDRKIAGEANPTLPTSDKLLSTAYRLAESMLVANAFLEKTSNNEWDEEKLNNMTVDDVDTIIDNLDTLADTIQDEKLKESLKQFSGASELTDEEKKSLVIEAIAKKKDSDDNN